MNMTNDNKDTPAMAAMIERSEKPRASPGVLRSMIVVSNNSAWHLGPSDYAAR
jgi:hypothetical protein